MKTRLAILIAGNFVFHCGCRQVKVETEEPAVVDLSLVRAGHEAVRDATKRRFERGAFISPSDDSNVDESIWMAPPAGVAFRSNPLWKTTPPWSLRAEPSAN
jgi:hypothetical protein